MKKLLALIMLLASSWAYAQIEGNAFTSTGRAVATTFVTDYEAASINPANLAWGTGYDNKRIAFGLGEVSFSAFTDAISKKKFNETFNNTSFEDFNLQEKGQAASEFTNKGISINLDASIFSFYFQHDKVGGIAIGVKDRFQYYTKFNERTSDLLFQGYYSSYFDQIILANGDTVANNPNDPNYENLDIQAGLASAPQQLSELFEGTEINVAYTREYMISYGNYVYKNEFIKIGAGATFKLVHGFMAAKLKSENGDLDAFISTSPDFDIDYGDAALNNPSASNEKSGSLIFPKKVGQGFGADFGFNVIINNRLKIGTAVNEIGSIKWTGNVYELNDTLLTEINNNGFDSYDVTAQINDVFDLDGIIKWSGQKSNVTKLPTTWRLGASYETLDGKVHGGVDVVVPLNDAPGNYVSPIYAIGGDVSPVRWFELQLGVLYGGNYRQSVNIPLGLKFRVGEYGTWEFGVASRDFLTWFTQDSPNLSAAFGFLRFRI